MSQTEPNTKACPYCAEQIATDAKVCKHCGRDVRQSRSRVMFVFFVIACLVIIYLVYKYVLSQYGM